MKSSGRRIRWGVLGCARIARILFNKAVQDSRTGEFQAIGSRDLEQATQWQADFGFPKAYGSYEGVLDDPDVDAVYIPLPNNMHLEWTVKAAKAGKHIFCEKPAAMNAEETATMVAAARDAGVIFVENFSFRFHPRSLNVRSLIDEGAIGDVRSVMVTFHNKLRRGTPNIRNEASMGGGVAMDLATYTIAFSRFVYKCEPQAVIAMAWVDPALGVDTAFNGVLDFGGGRMASFTTSFDTAGWQHARIIGTEAEITLRTPMHPRTEFDTTIIKHEKVAASGATRIDEETRFETPLLEPFMAVVDNIGDHLLAGAPLLLQPDDAINNMRVLDACMRSAREGRRIALN